MAEARNRSTSTPKKYSPLRFCAVEKMIKDELKDKTFRMLKKTCDNLGTALFVVSMVRAKVGRWGKLKKSQKKSVMKSGEKNAAFVTALHEY